MNPISQNEKMIQTSLILLLIGIFGYLFKFLFNMFLARHLGSVLYGDFSVAFRIFRVASVFMVFGTNSSAKRFFSKYIKTNQSTTASQYLIWNLRIILISSFAFLILLFLFTMIIFVLHIVHIHDIKKFHLAIYMLWIAPIGAISSLLTSYLLCNNNIYWSAFFKTIGKYMIGFFLLMPTIFFMGKTLNNNTLWLLILSIFIILVIAEWILILTKMSTLFKTSIEKLFQKSSVAIQEKKEWLSVSSHLILNQFIFLIIQALGIVLLEIIDKREDVVGFYGAALTISGVLWVTKQSVFQFVSPQISTFIDSRAGKNKLQSLVNKTQLFNLFINLIITACIIFYTTPILQSFGPDFLQTKITLWILLGAGMIATINTAAPKLLAYSGFEKYLIYSGVVEFLVMLIFGCIFIYIWSINGAALATLLSLLIRLIITSVIVQKKLKLKSAII